MATYELRPLSVGEILDAGFGIVRRDFGLMLSLAVITLAVPTMLAFYVEFAGGIAVRPGLYAVAQLLSIAGSLVVTGAIVRVVSEAYLGRAATLGDAVVPTTIGPFSSVASDERTPHPDTRADMDAVAATCRSRGLDVTLIEALPVPLERAVGEIVGTGPTTGREHEGKRQVRLKPLAEFRSMLEEPGRFLMIPAEEITHRYGRAPVGVTLRGGPTDRDTG